MATKKQYYKIATKKIAQTAQMQNNNCSATGFVHELCYKNVTMCVLKIKLFYTAIVVRSFIHFVAVDSSQLVLTTVVRIEPSIHQSTSFVVVDLVYVVGTWSVR